MSTASTPGSAPKAMSSRLLTMKFMQRAANSSPASNVTPSPKEPSLKRRRANSAGSPLQRSADSLADRSAVQAALAVEEAKRQKALEKQAAEAGDTRWVLSFENQKQSVAPALALRIVQTGFANLDASPSKMRMEGEEENTPLMVGRRSFGRFNKVLEKQHNPAYEESDDSEDSDSEAEEDDDQQSDEASESDEGDSMNQMNHMIKQEKQEAAERAKAERTANKRAAKEDLDRMAKKRRKQDVNLNTDVDLHRLTSLSGRQEPPTKKRDIECFRCGGPHMIKDCPTKKRNLGEEGILPPRKLKRYD